MPEQVTITFDRFRTPDGGPTCCADNPAGETCQFLGVVNFGNTDMCMFGEQVRIYRGDNGFTEPHANCPLWKEEV